MICTVDPKQEDLKPQVDRLAGDIASSGIGWAVSRSIAGAAIGNLSAGQIGEDGEYAALGTILGVFMGAPTAVRATNKTLKWGAGKVYPHLPDELQSAIRMEKDFRDLEIPNALGLNIDPRDKSAIRQGIEITNGIRKSLGQGRSAVGDFLQSGWVQSQWTTLRKMGKALPVVNKLQQILTDIPNQIKMMKANLDAPFNAQQYGYTFDEYLETVGPNQIAKIFNDMASSPANQGQFADSLRQAASNPKQMKAELNGALARAIHMGAGGPNQAVRQNIEEFYQRNSFARELDAQIQQNPEIMRVVEHLRGWFKGIEDRTKTALNTQVQRDIAEIEQIAKNTSDPIIGANYRENVLPILKNYMDSELSWGEYVKAIETLEDGKSLEQLAAAKLVIKDENQRIGRLFKRAIEVDNRLKQFDRFSGAYFPQIESRAKTAQLKARLIADPNSGVVDDATFEEWVDNRYFETNYKNDRKLYMEDTALENYNVRRYGSRNSAIDDLRRKVLNNTTFSAEQRAWADQNIDAFIKEGSMTKDGVTKKIYFLEVPENAPSNYFSTENREVHKQFMQKYRNTTQYRTKQSSRLDKVRRTEMPWEFAETDIRYITNTYANDVAPRIHAIENRMFDVDDLKENYLAPILKQVPKQLQSSVSEIGDRIAGIYNTSFRINNFSTGDEFRTFEKNAKWANRFRNVMASAYQYGIGYYNLFEHAVVSPLITSWDSYGKTWKMFAFNKQAANAAADLMQDLHVIDKQMKNQNGNLEYYTEFANDNMADRALERMANFSGEFSFTGLANKLTGGKILRQDNFGVYRIMFGGFTDSNIMSTAINGYSALYEVRKLSQIYKQIQALPEGAAQVVEYQGKNYSVADVKRGLEQLGIGESRLDGFLSSRTQGVLDMIEQRTKEGGRLTSEEMVDNAKELDYIKTVLNYATEAYHATNPITRPEKAMTPVGRMLFQYSNYSFNMVFQNFNKRIRFPVKDWKEQFGVNGNWNLAKIHWNFKQGNMKELANLGLSKEAIENYPAQAIDHTMKYFIGAMGISTVGNMSIDTFRDVMAYPVKEDEREQWKRLKRRTIVNPAAPKSEQITFGELFEEFEVGDLVNLGQYLGMLAFDNGLAGRYDIFYSQYGQPSLSDITPVTRAVDGVLKDITTMTSGLDNFGENATKVVVNNAFKYVPVIGASPFSEARNTVRKQLFADPKRPMTGTVPQGTINFDLIRPDTLNFGN